MFRVKWKGCLLIDGRDDVTEAGLLEAEFSSQELNIVPSEKEYNKKMAINVLVKCFTINAKEQTQQEETPYMDNGFPEEDHFTNSELLLEKMIFTDNMTITQGLKANPEMATKGIEAEMQQILDFGTMTYVKRESLSEDQYKTVLSSFMFLKNKYGEI